MRTLLDPLTAVKTESLIPEEADETLEGCAAHINELLQDGRKNLAELCRVCHRARRLAGSEERVREFVTKLDFGPEKFSMHAQIGADAKLDQYREHLKASYSVWYQVSQLSEEEFVEFENAGLLNDSTSRRDVEAFRQKIAAGPTEGQAKVEPEGEAEAEVVTPGNAATGKSKRGKTKARKQSSVLSDVRVAV